MSNSIENKINRLIRQNELLRKKVFCLQEYIVSKEYGGVSSVVNSDLSPVEIYDNGSEKTILAFSGMLTSLAAMPKAEFFGALSSEKINVIYLKDFYQCWYHRGLLGITKDIKTTAEYIRSILPKTSRQVVSLGTSSGGFAAILFGNLINVNRTISFSPQTYLNKDVFFKFRTPDSRWDEIKDSCWLDLKPCLNCATENHIYYGCDNDLDSSFAEYLNGDSSVVLSPVKTGSHNVAKIMKDKGILKTEILSKFTIID